jgi:AraC family transcriptional regulator, positive regulator of tynA and feaB
MIGESFSTKGVPASLRPCAFQDKMSGLFALGLEVQMASEVPFETEMTAFTSAKLQLASLRFSPHTTTRRAVPHAKENSCFILSLQRAGCTSVTQDGRTASIEAGDLFLLDTGRPFRIDSGSIWTESFYVPAAEIREAFWQVDSLTAVKIACESGAAAMLRGMFQKIFEIAPSIEEGSESRILSCALNVVELALTSLSGPLIAAPSHLDRFHRERIKRYIRDNLRDPDLCPQRIATGVQLSVRHVYELFTDEPCTLMRSIWNDRLAKCREDLVAVTLRRRTIGEIAYSWGFSDAAHFSRVFHDRFGEAPSSYRRSLLGSRRLAIPFARQAMTPEFV